MGVRGSPWQLLLPLLLEKGAQSVDEGGQNIIMAPRIPTLTQSGRASAQNVAESTSLLAEGTVLLHDRVTPPTQVIWGG